MAHKVVKYRLEADGTIPTWLTFGVPQSTGGMYAVADPNTASPQDWMMIGISAVAQTRPMRLVRLHPRQISKRTLQQRRQQTAGLI
jgi:hypothetical protein